MIAFESTSPASVSYNDFMCTGTAFGGSNIPPGLGELNTINNNGNSCDVYYNIFEDPLFADYVAGDFHLTWSNFPTSDQTKSTCIDAGNPSLPNDPDGTVADIGRYYFNQDIPTSIETDDSKISDGYILYQAYPNPFNSLTTITFDLPVMTNVTLLIYNSLGTVVFEKKYENLFSGRYEYKWDAVTMPGGLYFYRLRTDKSDITKKMIVVK